MSDTLFYVLCNDATGTDTKYETLIDALDAVNEMVGERDDWVVHELNSRRVGVVRSAAEGCGHIVPKSPA